MRMIRDDSGRFQQRPHFSVHELDAESERTVVDFLMKRLGAARFPISTDDLTRLLETHVDDLDLYSDLTELGSDVEGVTLFCSAGKPSVKISKSLDGSKRENRLRTTLSHELGHVLFHNPLFARAPHAQLFEDDDLPIQPQACRESTILNAGQSDWMEWQAGHISGAILMPATPLRDFISAKFPSYVNGALKLSPPVIDSMIEEIMPAFCVSGEAARIRLNRVGITRHADTAALF